MTAPGAERNARLATAIFVAPFVGCFGGAALFAVAGGLGQTISLPMAMVLTIVYGTAYSGTIGIAWMIVMGLPIHYFLQRLRQRHAWGYIGVGLLRGLAAVPFISWSAFLVTSGHYSAASAAGDSVRTPPFGALLGSLRKRRSGSSAAPTAMHRMQLTPPHDSYH